MFGRVTAQSIRFFGSRVKGHLHSAFHQARTLAGQIDTGVKVAGQVYSAFQPAIAEYAPQAEKQITRAVRGAKGDYDAIRDRVVGETERASAAIGSVKQKLPNLNLP